MANLSTALLILILVAVVVVALLIGYFLGTRFGGKKSVAMKQTTEKHDQYKRDVREHFEQTSAIMARMVEDYRDMYEHLSAGAQQLADIHPEKRVTPPPAPEAITNDHGTKQDRASDSDKTESARPESDRSTASGQRDSEPTHDAQAASGSAGEHFDKRSAASGQPDSNDKAKEQQVEPSGGAAAGTGNTATAGDSARTNAQPEEPAKTKKGGKRYGLE